MNDNIVLRKLKIAFNQQAEDILALLSLAGRKVSKYELSVFFDARIINITGFAKIRFCATFKRIYR